MTETAIDIADEIVDVLNGHTFSATFTAVRSYRAVYDLGAMTDLRVTVTPRTEEDAPIARGLQQEEYQIGVSVQKKPASLSLDLLDDLMFLVEEIAEFIREERRFGTAVWVRTETAPIYDPAALRDWGQFTSLLTPTLRLIA